MTLLCRLRLRAIRFTEDSRGAMPIEGLMAFTFLVWWYMASFQFFDALRQKNVNLKAAYTVADLMSRETGPDPTDPTKVAIDDEYIKGLNRVFAYLTFSPRPTWIRVSSIYWDAVQEKYRVEWSYATGGHPAQSDLTLQASKNRIPNMSIGDSAIVMETNMAYVPIFDVGLAARWYDTMIVTRPRFAACIPWDHYACGSNAGGPPNPDVITLDPDYSD